MTESIDDVFPESNADYAYVSILECCECGSQGELLSTGKPNPDWQWYECKDCSPNEAVEHAIVMSTPDGKPVRCDGGRPDNAGEAEE